MSSVARVSAGLVIFDCDGVLVDSEPISCAVLAECASDAGIAMTAEEARRAFQGESMARVVQALEARLARPLERDWSARFAARRDEQFARLLEAVPGAREAVLRVVAMGWEVCVASQGEPDKIRRTLALTGLGDLFAPERLFSATMVARPKPAPDLFVHAAAACGQPPGRCVAIDDGWRGIAGARAAGMRTLGFTRGADAAALSRAGAELVDELEALPGRLRGQRG